MKKNFRLHYRVFDGLTPTDRDRNYLLFTLIEPHKEGLRTLALDEDIFHKILKRCKTDEQRMKLKILISTTAEAAIKAGKQKGSILISI